MQHLPGMMYVKLRRALSICDTCPAFLVMNSSYIPSHCGGSVRIWPKVGRADLAPGLGSVDGVGIAAQSEEDLARDGSQKPSRRISGGAPVIACPDSPLPRFTWGVLIVEPVGRKTVAAQWA